MTFEPVRLLRRAAFVVAAVFSTMAHSQFTSDIDIYAGISSSTAAPNVLIIVDNTANWNNAFANEMAALITSFNNLPADRVRVGMMMFTETGGGNSGADGGYVRAAIRMMDTGYKSKLGALLTSLDVGNDKSNGGKAGLTMSEAYKYFAGKAPSSGNNKAKTDFSGNTTGTAASQAIYALGNNALAGKSTSPYISPILESCQRNYIIYISNGAVQDNSSDTSSASTALNVAYAAEGLTRPADITVSPSGSQTNVADEWARFMKASSMGISTYTIDVDKISTGQGPGWSAMLKSMAARGGGEYFDVNSRVGGGAQIADALNKIFNQIQSVNSVFASASLPVSVNARGTYLNQVFMGMFRPDGDSRPRWRGNLKQFKFNYDPTTDTLQLGDANGDAAISGATGFISPSAKSYWTTTSTFWINQALGTPPTTGDSPDGEVVEKGGAAQRIRTIYASSQATRNVYTCIACAANTSLAGTTTQFINTNTAITTTTLGVLTATDRTDLINWVRGTDNAGDELGPGGTTTIRPSVHGDVLHSRPAVVNYGGSTGVVVFYGTNDGSLRAVNGSQTGASAGNELWSFIPQEHLGKLARLRANSPEIRLSTTVVGTPVSALTPTPRDYFVDGSIGVYQKVLADGTVDKVYIYVTMRRGGRVMYALDVTDPAAPRFLWKKSASDITALGQTWSEPRVARIKGNTNPVIIMGAGYDNVAEDAVVPGTTTNGNAVLVMDAFTGTLLRQFNTDRSVPADVSLVDSDYDGLVDRAYAVDLGGNIYRLDFESGTNFAVSDWGMYKLASLTGSGTRKFFYAPDVVLSRTFAAVLIGSGDREKPLTTTSSDAFFTVYDNRATKGTPGSFTAVTPSSLGRVGSAEDVTNGCFIAMSTAGEKIINAPVTVGGITYFSSNKPTPPSSGSCTANLGEAKVYSAPLFCKTATSNTLTGGGLAPSPVTGVVTVSFTDAGGNPSTKQVPFIIGAPNSKGSGIEGSKVTPTVTPTRKRRYWYLEGAR